MWSALLLFFFCLIGVDSFSMCFKKGPTIKREQLNVQSTLVDEYHCKMECVSDEKCHSYSYTNEGVCVHACGEPDPTSGHPFPPEQWIKTKDARDCTEVDEQQPSSTYAAYVATVLDGQTALDHHPNNVGVNPCPYGSVLDVVLPNNEHIVYGNGASQIIWENKVGSWQFLKHNIYGLENNRKTIIIETYIRAARCYTVNPMQFADTSSCGGTLPIRDVNATTGYVKVGSGNVEKFGVFNYCTDNAVYIQVHSDTYLERPETSYTSATRVICVDGSWILVIGKEDASFKTTQRIKAGTCVDKTNSG